MTCFINKNILTIIYLFYYLFTKIEKLNSETKNLKDKNNIFNRTEGVHFSNSKFILK